MKTRYSDPEAERQRIRVFTLAVDPEHALAAVETRGGHAGTYRYVADRLAEGLTLERALEYLDAGVADEVVRCWESLRSRAIAQR
jgi:hypothetical protein